ncbi:cobalt/nickel ABC transporter permease [Gracilibacillus halophilus YIM-C55.5]|uniref:Cobalt/nickel ABC transporter permease n=1 Tax=Gracilibacillus halophilus YIM-C55.5 TaxID=1308866 RepID=N4WTX2_9BACI|nr:energy-coupling factor transporter transmembrane component T [Gracilibacillus halophilus]ENH97810.1 cobalt/nickel ABC transporter permease [Gracilibacillus halophilus YIM-C55.5]
MTPSFLIGQYISTGSVIHRLDPRIKLVMVFIFVFIVFFANHLYSYVLFSTFVIVVALATKIRLSYILKGIMPVGIFLLFTFFLHVVMTNEGQALLTIGPLTIYTGGVIRGIEISVRLFLLVFFTSLLTLTTPPMAITDGLEKLLSPLKKVGVPVHEFALMVSITLRFIPTLMEETDKISKAQASRGVDFRSGSLKSRAYAVVSLLIPLFISSFRRADDLALAMEARGYRGGEGRTNIRALILQKRDYVAMILYGLMILLFIFVQS